jgi:hypothetical protein
VFYRHGALGAANQEARAWLAELPGDQDLPSDLGLGVPMWLLAAVFGALAGAGGGGAGTARARVRTRRGTWLVCHASLLGDADGVLTGVAVVIEPATAAEIAPIIVAAHDLTEREQQITGLIARGAGTAEIAGEPFLSVHTVRDHVKAIFAKVGVQPGRAGRQALRRPLPAHPPPARRPDPPQLSVRCRRDAHRRPAPGRGGDHGAAQLGLAPLDQHPDPGAAAPEGEGDQRLHQ